MQASSSSVAMHVLRFLNHGTIKSHDQIARSNRTIKSHDQIARSNRTIKSHDQIARSIHTIKWVVCGVGVKKNVEFIFLKYTQ
jgi:hypothetical protein